MGYRLSKHKMTRYCKNLCGHDPVGSSWLRLFQARFVNSNITLRVVSFRWCIIVEYFLCVFDSNQLQVKRLWNTTNITLSSITK